MLAPIKYLNGGIGLVATGKRQIKSGQQYEKYWPRPNHKEEYLSYAGTTHETIDFMANIIKNTLNDTKLIAIVLKKTTLDATLTAIFSFVFEHYQYRADDPQNEELRRPARAWADREKGVDCDCYAITIGSILSILKIPFSIKMVKIMNRPYFQHVYIVVPKDGKESSLQKRDDYYVIDPVLDTYNEEHPYTEKYEIFMQPIKYLNGVSRPSLNGMNGHTLGNTDSNLYYSPEAAEFNRDAVFFDGLNYYERINGLNGLHNLRGLEGLGALGFLKKIWGAAKIAGKFVKKIGGKAIKKIVKKKDGTTRGVFKMFEGNPQKKAARKAKRSKKKAARKANRVERKEARQLRKVSAKAITSTASSGGGATAAEMIDIAQKMDKSTPLDTVLNIAKTAMPDTQLLNDLISARTAANKPMSAVESRMISQDVAKAAMFDNMNKAGFGGLNIQTGLMILLAGGVVWSIARSNTKAAA